MIRSIFFAALIWQACSPIFAQETDSARVAAGRGSYTTERPSTIKALPEKIYTTDWSVPVPTNQWWSSILWEPHSSNLFPHPLGMVCHEGGLSVGYPGAAIVASPDAIMGAGVSANGDVNIGLKNGDVSENTGFAETVVAEHSQWFIETEFADNAAVLRTRFGHGSPFVFCTHENSIPRLTFAEKPLLWFGKNGDKTIGITVRGNHYGLFAATGSSWSQVDETTVSCLESKGYFTIGLLPDNSPSTLKWFEKLAHNHVVDTELTFSIEDGNLRSAYRFETRAMEGDGSETIFALYPHHWKYSNAELSSFQYDSVRGKMKVASGDGFKTSVPIQGVLPILPADGIQDRDRLIAYLRQEANRKPPKFRDTYWEGKHLGSLATLAGIAEAVEDAKLEAKFVGELKRRLENWFTASIGEVSPLFHYDANWTTLIGSKPSFGSDDQLNDHHFHYGYFIRAAAEIARRDQAWAKAWGPMVEMLIRDIASNSNGEELFPRLRCFDVYAGHSWASGNAKFADGNNQESSSESMNAWYGMMLWGEATGNDQVRDTGVMLFNTERVAIEEYWFDVSGDNFPKDFPNVALGMVWGGKGAFATWFSEEIDCIHGINWLPFTPASIYMGRFPNYVKANHDDIIERRKSGRDYNQGWGDLVAMFGALHDATALTEHLNANPDCKIESGNTRAFMYQWAQTLTHFGQNDASVTADYPFANVFRQSGKKWWVIYNFRDEPLSVTFSDGTILRSNQRGIKTKSELQNE